MEAVGVLGGGKRQLTGLSVSESGRTNHLRLYQGAFRPGTSHAKEPTVKERVSNVVANSASGIGAALAGARWWAVLLAMLVVLVSTYGAVIWLVLHLPHPPRRISTPLITIIWDDDHPSEPEEPPPKQPRPSQ
jgi:hypothetical protein